MILAIDTETTGTSFFHGCRPFMITACDGSSTYVWKGEVNPYTREVFWCPEELDDFRSVLDRTTKVVMHNSTFDMRALHSIGINIKPLWSKLEDTLIAAHAINAAHEVTEKDKKGKNKKKTPVGRSLGLKPLALEYFRFPTDDEKELEYAVKKARDNAPKEYFIATKDRKPYPGIRGNYWKTDYWMAMEECRKYGVGDAVRTHLLWSAFKHSLLNDNLWDVYKLRMELDQICYEIISEGVDFDDHSARQYIHQNEETMEKLRWKMKELGDIKYKFSPSKRDHVIDLLHNRCGIPINMQTDDGKPQIDKTALDFYKSQHYHECIDVYREWKSLETKTKYVRGYVDWVVDGKIHGNLNTTGTRETRQSASSPNLQNTTGELERYFHPRKGEVWLDADFDNIEMRIWAYSVNNADMVAAFERGESIHMMVYEELFPAEARKYLLIKDKDKSEMDSEELNLSKLYRNIKAFNFGIIYGCTETTADNAIGRQGSYRRLINRFPEIQQFGDRLLLQIYENLRKYNVAAIHTLGGYRLPVPIDEPFKASNYYVQGTAGIITTKAAIRIRKHPDYAASGSRMKQQVHDSIKTKIPYCSETIYLAEEFKREMEKAGEELIPTCTVSYKLKYHPDDEPLT